MPTPIAPRPSLVTGWDEPSILPRPPTRHQAHANSAIPMTSSSGAAQVSKTLMEFMPRQMMATLISQKTKKQPKSNRVMPNQPGRTVGSSAAPGARAKITARMAVPPIQVCIPNQPQATRARIMAGTLAPRTPNEERSSTGKGIPY